MTAVVGTTTTAATSAKTTLTHRDDVRCPQDFLIGFTNLIDRPTPGTDALRTHEYVDGARELVRKLEWYRPRVICFVGYGVFEAFVRVGVREGWVERVSVADVQRDNDRMISGDDGGVGGGNRRVKGTAHERLGGRLVRDYRIVFGGTGARASSSTAAPASGTTMSATTTAISTNTTTTHMFVVASTSPRPKIPLDVKMEQFRALKRVVDELNLARDDPES